MFLLTKWYLDLVTDQGAALIVYASTLEWAALRVRYASTLVVSATGDCAERSVWSGVSMPTIDGSTVRFEHQGLRFSGQWKRDVEPLRTTMLDGPDGRLDWWCLTPNGSASVSFGDQHMTGRGYAECITMSCAPWTLPLRQLRWGRYTSQSHSVVWIDWRGGPPRRWFWFDGVEQNDAVLEADRVSGLCNSFAIRMEPVGVLRDRRALQALSAELPALETLPIGRLKDLHEVKRLARGELWHDGAQVDEGWIIDELVTW